MSDFQAFRNIKLCSLPRISSVDTAAEIFFFFLPLSFALLNNVVRGLYSVFLQTKLFHKGKDKIRI